MITLNIDFKIMPHRLCRKVKQASEGSSGVSIIHALYDALLCALIIYCINNILHGLCYSIVW